MPTWIIFSIIGTLAGVFSGFFGIGGAVIMIPLLTGWLGFSQHLAQGTAIAALLLPIGAVAAWKYHQAGHVHWVGAMTIAVTFIVGSYFGAVAVQGVDASLLKRLFGGLLLAIGLKIVLGK